MPGTPPTSAPRGGVEALNLAQAMTRAFAAYQHGDVVEAERLCRAVLGTKSDNFDALHLSGIIAARTGRAQAAVDLLQRAVASDPKDAAAHAHLGNVLRGLNRAADGLHSYERALALNPAYAEAWYGRGNALRDLNRIGEALESYERTIALAPNFAEAHNNRGVALHSLCRPAEALQSYDRALALKRDFSEAHNNRGMALVALNRHREALDSYDRALALKPDYAECHYNRGVGLSALDRRVEALQSFDRAVALDPRHVEAYNDRGIALFDLRRYAEAIESYERALALEPHHAPAHTNLALCRLLLGDFARGWEDYEWRLKVAQEAGRARSFAQQPWRGAPALKGKTILLHNEQGLGDALQFCRYASEVAALGANVLLEVQRPLVQLLAGVGGVTQAFAEGSPLPAFDYECPLMSLPLAFKTNEHNVPSRTPYIRSDPQRVATWRERLGNRSSPRVGFAWRGSPTHKNDRNRSIALADILRLIDDWAEWISLQKDIGDADAALLASRADVRNIAAELESFADTAAVVELLDMVVTVDTSIAHLAGAMGKPVWILLPFNPDWRWLLDRPDSIWYPTVRLFRQSAPGDWATVIQRLRDDLEKELRGR